MSTRYLPTLSMKGWVSDPVERLDFALTHMFIAEESQTYLSPDIITDLHSLLAATSGQIETGILAMQDKISDYLRRQFDDAQVDVIDASARRKDPSMGVELILKVTVWQDDTPYSIEKVVNKQNAMFKTLTNIHNTGNPN